MKRQISQPERVQVRLLELRWGLWGRERTRFQREEQQPVPVALLVPEAVPACLAAR